MVLLFVGLLSALQDAQMQALVAKHQAYLDAIQTLEVEVRAELSEDGGLTWQPEGTVLWRKDGERHRFSTVRHGKASAFNKYGMSTVREHYIDRDESRLFERPDPPLSRSPRPGNGYALIDATISGPHSAIGIEGAPVWLLLHADVSYTLPELYRKSTTKRLLGKVNVDGAELWGLQLLSPEHGNVLNIYLDPARSYAVVRREIRGRDGSGLQGFNRVLAATEAKPGIWLPTHFEGRSLTDATALDARVRSIKVNEALPADAFAFSFPTGAKVRNGKTGERHIWGDGVPALTFSDPDQFRQWERTQLAWSAASQGLKVLVLLGLVFVSVLVVRQWLRGGRMPRVAG